MWLPASLALRSLNLRGDLNHFRSRPYEKVLCKTFVVNGPTQPAKVTYLPALPWWWCVLTSLRLGIMPWKLWMSLKYKLSWYQVVRAFATSVLLRPGRGPFLRSSPFHFPFCALQCVLVFSNWMADCLEHTWLHWLLAKVSTCLRRCLYWKLP